MDKTKRAQAKDVPQMQDGELGVMGIFGTHKGTNSDLADERHSPVESEDIEEKEEAASLKWKAMKGYPCFQLGFEGNDWNIARCSICGLEFEWDASGTADTFYTLIELHQLRHTIEAK